MNRKEMGKIIHKGRIDKEMSRSELAKMVGCNPATIYRWENGELSPSLKSLALIEDVLEMGILTKEFMNKAGGKT